MAVQRHPFAMTALLGTVAMLHQVLATDLSCHLQKGPVGALMPEVSPEVPLPSPWSLSSPWSQPGLHFEHCPVAKKASRSQLMQMSEHEPAPLPNKTSCPFGSMPIGQLHHGIYNFSCCYAGAQCGGCRQIVGNTCIECAAGYTRQEIPVLNTSLCFLCDDLPNWQDALSRTCYDYSALGLCRDGKVKNSTLDVAFRGVSPSEACCACGGGSVYPTPTRMNVVYDGQVVHAQPQPPGLGILMKSCQLDGLQLNNNGSIQGTIPMNSTVHRVECSFLVSQDPVRGIYSTVKMSVPVSPISYGKPTLVFKHWGLDRTSTSQFPIRTSLGGLWNDFQLTCTPKCPWLHMNAQGTLTSSFPSNLVSGLETYGTDACSCQAYPLCM